MRDDGTGKCASRQPAEDLIEVGTSRFCLICSIPSPRQCEPFSSRSNGERPLYERDRRTGRGEAADALRQQRLLALVVRRSRRFRATLVETLAAATFAYDATGSPFIVTMITMRRRLPMGVFGAFLGVLPDRIERRISQIAVTVLMGTTFGVMALLALSGHLAIWHLAVASFITGVGWATDNPVRRVTIGAVVSNQTLGVAMSVDVGTSNASQMFGPSLGGLLVATVGVHGAFVLSVSLFATSLVGLLGLNCRTNKTWNRSTLVLVRLREGLVAVRSDRRLIGTFLVTMIYNSFRWRFISLVPMIAHDRLHLNSLWTGILTSGDGVGTFIGAAVIA